MSPSNRSVRDPRPETADPADGAGLEVRGLRVSIGSGGNSVDLIDGVDLSLAPGRRLALVGESGSGKSLTATALMGLVDYPLRSKADVLRLGGVDLARLSPQQWRKVRGPLVSMVQQDPLTALSPVFSAGSQVAEAARSRTRDRKQAWAQAIERMREVGIPDPAIRANDYPHQLSGGLRQRVAIAMALASEPSLMIADEPTTALDVTVQAQIIELLRTLSEQRGMSVVFITHDLGIVPGFAHELAVMYAGRIVETGAADTVLSVPRHPYTHALIASQPGLDPSSPKRRLPTIPGSPPLAKARPPGCPFAPRCPLALEICTKAVPELRLVDERLVACHRAEEAPELLGAPA
ncbi:ABC transporter ATP-binding protein [Lysobacter korlensis]|uniref:ABC-type dipeptide transporter n=1 Tax=Lysobacter korlensis TaxID=553636 RepID=A0ABV6RU39_9GAMM